MAKESKDDSKKNYFSCRPDDETAAILEAVKNELGIKNTPLFNQMLREFAKKRGIKAKVG